MCYTTTPLVFKNKLRKADQEKVVALQSKHGCKAQRCFTLYLWWDQHSGGLYFRPWEHKDIFLKSL